jgi:hypothetical protein
MANDSGQDKGTPRDVFGPAKKYARGGSSREQSGWQEEHPAATAEGDRRAPRAAKSAITRTPLAERLRRHVAEHGEER